MSLIQEIHAQPQVLKDALLANHETVMEIAEAAKSASTAFIAARGTSDNAARYAKYLWGAHNRLPVMLAAPSLFSLYGEPPRLPGSLVIGISQSGESPDIVAVLAEGKRQGCPTLAITNAPDSPLAQAADFVLDIRAGVEKAVAATKTYTAQLLAIAMLSAAMQGDKHRYAELQKLPEWTAKVLELDDYIANSALRYRYMQHCSVLGRGYNYATAFEWSLKLKELTYVVAEPYSSADFKHGPIAMVGGGFPVFVVAPGGAVFEDMLGLVRQLRDEHDAELMVISDQQQALELADTPVELPAGIPEWLSPMVTIVPAQLFSYHLTRIKGYDTETPRGLKKVTRTH